MMQTDVHVNHDTNVSSQIGEVIEEFERLFGQQLKLLRKEVKADFTKSCDAASYLALGIVGCLFAIGLFTVMVVALLMQAGMSLAGASALVGVVFAGAGAALVTVGVRKFASFNPLPDETAKALEENLTWMTKKPT